MKRIGSLSGGEAARHLFCRHVVLKPNVMVLDQPTNHLDLEAIETLTEGLSNYPGTLLLVSHDRWFVSRLATRIIEILQDGVNDFVGSHDEYLNRTSTGPRRWYERSGRRGQPSGPCIRGPTRHVAGTPVSAGCASAHQG